MSHTYQHLGVFSDWVQAAREQQPLFPAAAPGRETQQRVREVLGFSNRSETPRGVQIEQRWQRDGVSGEEVSWSVGYGPRTHAFVLKPTEATQPLPGIVALFDHGGFKFYGKEKIVDEPADPPPVLVDTAKDSTVGGLMLMFWRKLGLWYSCPMFFCGVAGNSRSRRCRTRCVMSAPPCLRPHPPQKRHLLRSRSTTSRPTITNIGSQNIAMCWARV